MYIVSETRYRLCVITAQATQVGQQCHCGGTKSASYV
jgi:hypothetical protein